MADAMEHTPATPPTGPLPADTLVDTQVGARAHVPAQSPRAALARASVVLRSFSRRIARWLYDWTRGSRWRTLIPFRPYIP